MIKIGAYLSQEERNEYQALLSKFLDMFAWYYKEMLNFITNFVMNCMVIHDDANLIKKIEKDKSKDNSFG